MNAPSSCRLVVDPALYTSVAGVMKSLSEHFHCVKSVTGLIQAKKGNRFYKTQNEIYMVQYLNFVYMYDMIIQLQVID